MPEQTVYLVTCGVGEYEQWQCQHHGVFASVEAAQKAVNEREGKVLDWELQKWGEWTAHVEHIRGKTIWAVDDGHDYTIVPLVMGKLEA